MNITISNEFAEIESMYSQLADIRVRNFVKDPTDDLPMRTKDLLIERLNIEQVKDLNEILAAYIVSRGGEDS